MNQPDINLADFPDWVLSSMRDIEHVQGLCKQPLSDDPAMLVTQMQELAAWLERMNALFAEAKGFYYTAKRKALIMRQEGYTDLDRETIQKSEIVPQRLMMDTLEGIVEAIRTILMVGMNLRKTHVAERPQENA